MKKNIKYMNQMTVQVFALVFALVVLSSCNKYLDKKPDNLLTSDMVWQTRANAEAYLNQIYSYVQTELEADNYTRFGASDETSCSFPGVNVRLMTTGNWNVQSNYWYNWGAYYAGIRQSIVFEQNIDRVPVTQLSSELKAQYKEEALFLRGWFYWSILKQYGPFVKLDKLLSLTEDFNQYPRASFDTCITVIDELMTRAAAGLPAKWNSSSDYGRPTKGACLAVKAQVALWAASPLWNGNTQFAGFKNEDGTTLAPKTYNPEKWKAAASAAKAVIDLDAYKLFTNLDEGAGQFDPYLSYRDLFLTNWNDEIIFSTNVINSWYWGQETRCAPKPGGYNMQNATQNIVDAFYMRNGRTIDDPASGYIETGFVQHDDPESWGVSKDGVKRGYIKGNRNMYVDREARFYVSILFNGQPVLAAPSQDDRNYYSSSENIDGRGRVEFYYNGKSGVLATATGDITGYNVQKGMNPASNPRTSSTNYRPYIHIRFAEILLDYIEALNEYDPGNAAIIKYLDEIRSRAGLPGFATVYPEKIGKQAAMREVILRERQIELCFEGDRYFTLIRRKLMNDPKIQQVYRMNVGENDNGQGFAFEGFYKRTLLQSRYWNDKMYLFPIAQTDMEKDQALVQNPLW